ncbi:hypothetical protein [Paenibacillus campinasensis]|uniref:Uncharacterized protein n=1 Tax=Paenibacillus campinasensis TaxID=66347 RepID=A0A268ELG7_9BACL|nr:hypothetical protein [Paenibacillus campinasensis]PAD73951.1 hypothetical protein CHH67_19140 [Paenibacillus campinasensis]
MDRNLIRKFQKMKSMSNERFWQEMNDIHTRAYAMGIKHMREAMECHPRISKPMVQQVLIKADEIREKWDGLRMVTVDDTESEQFRTAAEIIHNLTPTEGYIFNLKEEAVISIAGRQFKVQPVQEEGQHGDVDTQA